MSLEEVCVLVHPGETDSGVFLESSAVACGAENDLDGAHFVFLVAEKESGVAQFEFLAAETDLGGAQFCGAATGLAGPDARRVGSFGDGVDGGVRHPTRVVQRACSVGVRLAGAGYDMLF